MISLQRCWCAEDKVDDMMSRIKSDLNSWHACIRIDPITHTVTNPRGASGSGASSDFLDASESHNPLSGSIRIETSLFRKMGDVYMHAPWSSALPSAVKILFQDDGKGDSENYLF
jgi:hypothetical protein